MATETRLNRPSTEIDGSIAGRIVRLRQMQTELRTRPVTGSLPALKKLFFQIIRSTFSRQFILNMATVDLIESLHRELERCGAQLRQQSTQLQGHAQRVIAPVAPPGAQISTGEVVASCGQTQDQAKVNNIRPLHGFNHVYTAPAELRMPERVVLYSLIFGLQPRTCLEIGTFRGGSSAIICGAMDDTGFGQLACVDPQPRIAPDLWSQISARCRLFEGPSPDILPDVARQMGAAFDFAFVDGNHTYDYLRRDIAGVLPYLAEEAYVLFHDAHYAGAKRAIDEAVGASAELTDCGLVSVEPTVIQESGRSVSYAGLRLLRFQRSRGR